jgi:hypothetical protein
MGEGDWWDYPNPGREFYGEMRRITNDHLPA